MLGHHLGWAAWHRVLQPDTGGSEGGMRYEKGWADTFLLIAHPKDVGSHRDSLSAPVIPRTWDTCLGASVEKRRGFPGVIRVGHSDEAKWL